jgi:murein DD-endopeptidase MepM/ murein hydrolase activator NlpD
MRLENIFQERSSGRFTPSELKLALVASVLILTAGCGGNKAAEKAADHIVKTPIAASFAYPIGKTPWLTEARDNKDNWYNAQNFRENNHLGEDWNTNTGGNSDCGETVYAAATGVVTYADHAGSGWGNVVIIEHRLEDGSKVQSLYGHLQTIARKKGVVKKREKIGTVGNTDGKYLCHLHLEMRDDSCLMWDRVFIGYCPINKGWLDPSEFIDQHL